MKAYLISKKESLVRTHDLVFLVNLAAKKDGVFKELREKAAVLNRYYIDTRYPLDFPTYYSKEEAKRAIDDVYEFRKIIRAKLKLKI